MLPHLPKQFNAVVTGANGGIGNAILQRLLSSSQPGHIIAVSRSPLGLQHDKITSVVADLTTSIGRHTLAEAAGDRPVHLLVNTIGMFHGSDLHIQPEKRLEQLSEEAFMRVMQVNAMTPVMLLAALKPCLQGKHPCIIASLSARVGSITDNGYGGWYSYRASKAAHNMLMKTAAIEIARLNKQAIVLCLHPGTTDTLLSKPFQARVPSDKLFTAEYVADRLLEVMAQRTPEETGSFWDWAGEPIEW
ncbi:SDR family NAD(P)-dependent oxidoreductase [Halomonas sp. C22]|uniref:SDR family NAD(P)-dependent oxidoreductase n=1 Tax=Halomonas sp. C22 TaxID=2580567 RepID=UPI0011A422B8|nr:SDR family NAD(P)-dependent oxidoreductase [Halomonas sp. C22]